MTDNPFLSKTFTSIWLKYFKNSEQELTFNFIDVSFIKHKFLPIYTNVGRNNTNGIDYSLIHNKNNKGYKNKVFLIHDVPEYFDVNTSTKNKNLKINKAIQYKGFLADLTEFDTFEEFFKANLELKEVS